jgi:hypothetical protein
MIYSICLWFHSIVVYHVSQVFVWILSTICMVSLHGVASYTHVHRCDQTLLVKLYASITSFICVILIGVCVWYFYTMVNSRYQLYCCYTTILSQVCLQNDLVLFHLYSLTWIDCFIFHIFRQICCMVSHHFHVNQ